MQFDFGTYFPELKGVIQYILYPCDNLVALTRSISGGVLGVLVAQLSMNSSTTHQGLSFPCHQIMYSRCRRKLKSEGNFEFE